VVADAPVRALVARLDDLTKGWLLALIEQAPLDGLPAILAAEIARDGPRLCEALILALADDADLRRLEAGGAVEPLAARAGELAGASGPEATARAVDALGAVVWSALRDEVSDPVPDQVAELAERLELVISLVRAAALRRTAAGGAGAGGSGGRFAAEEPGGEALWAGALADEIARAERIGAPLSLLLVELDDADRMLAVEGASEAESMFGRFARAVRSAVRRQDILASETETRAWIIARDTARVGADALALRVAAAVRESPSWRGAPLGVSVGVAVLGEDGRDSPDLIEAAEEAGFAAQAGGITVIRADAPSPDHEAS
jgi:GGDEF domain-containing protein